MPTRTLLCQNCGKPLSGKAQRWCGQPCARAGWAKTHLPERARSQAARRARIAAGLPLLKPIEQRVLDLEAERAQRALTPEGTPA